MTHIKSTLLLTLLSSTLLAGTVIAEEHDVQKSEQANQSTNQLPEVSTEDKKAQEEKATKQGKHQMLRTKFLSRRPYQGK